MTDMASAEQYFSRIKPGEPLPTIIYAQPAVEGPSVVKPKPQGPLQVLNLNKNGSTIPQGTVSNDHKHPIHIHKLSLEGSEVSPHKLLIMAKDSDKFAKKSCS